MQQCIFAGAFLGSLILVNPVRASETGQWEIISDEGGFVTKRKEADDNNILVFRGETIADAPISKILSIFLDSSRRKDWVDMFLEQEDLQQRGPLEKIYWIRFKTPAIMSDRDYVLQVNGEDDSRARVLTARIHSVEMESKPPKDCCVRATVFETYYRFEAIPGMGKTRVAVEVHTDPKGWIPTWLVNIVQKNWPRKTLTNLIAAAKEPNVPSHPDYKSWEEAIVLNLP